MGRNGSGVKAASGSSIEITFTYRGQRCRERLKIQPTAANLKRAERHRAAILDAIDNGTFDYAVTFPDSPRRFLYAKTAGGAITLERHLEAWLKDIQPRLKASTYAGFANIARRHIIPHLGKYTLTQIGKRHIKTLCIDWAVGNKTLTNRLSVLRAALTAAVDDELIETNPLYGWTFRLAERIKDTDDIDPFTPAEQAAILQQLSGQDRNLIQFAFWTGLRTSELIALQWQDIDWRSASLRIVRAKTNAARQAEPPKTRAGVRQVKLLTPALQALKAQRQHTELAGAEIFRNPRTGEPWNTTGVIRGMWERALKRAKIRYRRPYQTRHTYASMMLSAGESPLWVAKQMGHADWTMIARTYGKWMPDADPEAGEKALRRFWPSDKRQQNAVNTPTGENK